ncbi:ABC transporter DrrB family efflux protein [Saccharopolyspora lacisalsi]|uniref:Transport permease protein n=1 Tax=Halosaccharopolyspora lacisalsi TaxID=1000566 RepID=A0A839DN81_9PSEU|nr:ABC transporter permease [Halosaccharopolyspora lacisalsi]MBA8822964.1 ABC transporter DrrB family efflux protein [Halosaccharopolyspora lacisalsi]
MTAPFVAAPVQVFRDGGIVAWRNFTNTRRTPGALFSAVLQPLMFVLLLAYVFGGSLGGDSYREYLLGGIFAQSVTFNASFTALGLANDLSKGMVERFRSLPMSRVAVILGRTTSDMATSVITLVVTGACGLLVGWRIRGGFWEALAAFGLLLLFAFAMAWVGALIGLTASSVEVAQSMGLIWLFPVTFASTAFVSAARMPPGLRTIAEWNPVSAVADSVRGLFGNPTPAGLPQPDGWPSQHPTLYAVLSAAVLIAVFLPLAAARYRRVCAR